MKNISLLAASVAIALTGCGGSDGGSSDDRNAPSPGGVIIKAVDGYLANAEVWVDTNGNLKLDETGTDSDTKLADPTDANGEFTLSDEYKDSAVFIKAIADKTIDTTRGLVSSNFVIAATAGSTVVNPMTNMVVEQMAGDDTMTQEDAEAAVVASVTDSGLTASEELIFGDYIAQESDDAKALNAIGETLVDHSDLPVEKQLELTDKVAEQAKIIIDDTDQELDDFDPVVDVPADPTAPITVTPNSRPVHDQADNRLDTVTLDQGGSWTDLNVSAHFSDADTADILTFELKELTGAENGNLTINLNTGVITTTDGTGVLNGAGAFHYQIFAQDNHGALSYPLNLTVEVIAPNQAPTIDWAEYEVIQAQVNEWDIQQGVPFENTIDVTNLFKDADGNVVEYRAGQMSIAGLTVSPAVGSNPILTISGTPTNASKPDASEFFMIYSVDDNSAKSGFVEMLMPKVAEGIKPEPTLGFTQAHFDKGGIWQMGSFDYGDGEFAFASLRMEAGQHKLCWASEDNEDSTISRDNWMATFNYQAAEYKANSGNVIGGDDCMPVTLNADGTVEVEGDAPGSVTTISMVYQHITKNGDYQIIMTFDEGDTVELFWLDSTEDSTGTIYNTFTYPSPSNRPVNDVYTEYLLTDDATGFNKLDPLLDQFTYTVTKTSGFNSETLLAEGTYQASSISYPGENWSGSWVYDEVPPTGGLSYLGLPEFNDDVNRDILRRYFTYREFGDLKIGVGDSDKDYGHDNQGFFFITSENEEIIESIDAAWPGNN